MRETPHGPSPYDEPEIETGDAAPLLTTGDTVQEPPPTRVSWTAASLILAAAVLLLIGVCT